MPRRASALVPRLTAALVGSVGLSAGCGRVDDVRPGDIRTYSVHRSLPRPVPANPGGGSAPAAIARGRLRYDVPEGWIDRGASGMRLASLVIGDPSLGREVTVIPASGTLRGNVERWHGQLVPQAEPAARQQAVDAALAAAATVEAGPRTATVVLLEQPADEADSAQAILGAVIPLDDDSALFVKFKGAADVARGERDAFIRFVTSIRWDEPDRPRKGAP